jgi:ornithine decarboxylase
MGSCTSRLSLVRRIIAENSSLPDLAIGEWVYVENFGAYTIAAASTFNGFQQTRCVYCFV